MKSWLWRLWHNGHLSTGTPVLPVIQSSSNSSNMPTVRRRMATRRIAILAFVSLATLAVVGLFYYLLSNDTSVLSERPDRADNDSTGDRRRYGIVIDAGSSGSRVMVYSWDDLELQHQQLKAQLNQIEKSNATAEADQRIHQQLLHLPAIERASEHWTFKTSPGISSFADRPRRVGIEHIKPLLDFAQKQVPKRQMAETPVFLLATAGMRLLARSHRSLLLDTACSFARANYDFLLPDCQESFQVVSGEVEGLYGWIAVNYLLDGFRGGGRSTGSQEHIEQSAPQRFSHGFLDMGGASAQIAFEPAKLTSQLRKHDLAEVTLRSLDGSDVSFNVFVATFLGHGTNEARRRFVGQLRGLARTPEGADTPIIDDPCLPPGLTLPTVDNQIVLRGTGSFAQCTLATEPLLNKTVCPVEPCLFAGVHAPEIDFGKQSFVGVSEYWYAAHNYLGLGGVWDVEKFEAQATKFCQTPWAEVMQMGAGDALAVARLQMQCFKAAWLVNVLHKGFGVPRNQASVEDRGGLNAVDKLAQSAAPFQSVNQVGDVEVSWTLGALLLKVSQMIKPDFHTIKAKSVPGIRLPSTPGVIEDGVELIDDSLWSPLRFVGIRRLLVLWSMQPTSTRLVLIVCVLATVALLVFLLYWLFVHRRSRYYKQLGRYSATGMANGEIPLGVLSRSPPLPSQLPRTFSPSSSLHAGYPEAVDNVSNRVASQDTDIIGGNASNGKELRHSSSVFMLDMLSGPLQSVLTPTVSPPSPNAPLSSADSRMRSVALVMEEPPISRSSSFNSLLPLSRRRGAGIE
ncbi:Golgi apyrase [Coemansia asiatica]|nr:Golgi apyrase [Coemansia asiatica]